MILLPAIDLYEGKAVRLYKGDYARMTVYADDPLFVADDFALAGAEWIHVVDLEGSRSGTAPHLEQIKKIKSICGLRVEVGGGIRNEETLNAYMDAGIDRAIIGTAAVRDEDFLKKALARFGERIAVGADVKDGRVSVSGWTEQSAYDVFTFVERMTSLGVRTIVCTDVSRDGAMRGSNRELYQELSRKGNARLIASGGVSSLDDVRALKALGLYGAIVGKAYYSRQIDLKTALEEAK